MLLRRATTPAALRAVGARLERLSGGAARATAGVLAGAAVLLVAA
jgi:hypothetical protein